jgi:4-diphosphocytidyl-2-C-methyl-D-erythritol kinase
MVPRSFGDELTVTPSDRPRFFRHASPTAPRPITTDWPIESDLVFRAHAALESLAARPLPVQIELHKSIPAGAGLGGGSADAAATLDALSELFNLEPDAQSVSEQALGLGSDVPFALEAIRRARQPAAADANPSAAALVTGFGDRLTPAPLRPAVEVVLVLPDFSLPTGPVFAAFDQLEPPAFDQNAVADLTAQPLTPDANLFNHLEPAAVRVEPRLGQLLRHLRHDLRLPAHLTGSGSTCFILCRDSAEAQALAHRLGQRPGLATVATRTT